MHGSGLGGVDRYEPINVMESMKEKRNKQKGGKKQPKKESGNRKQSGDTYSLQTRSTVQQTRSHTSLKPSKKTKTTRVNLVLQVGN